MKGITENMNEYSQLAKPQSKKKWKNLLYFLLPTALCIGILVAALCLHREPAWHYIDIEPIDWYYRCEKTPEFKSLATFNRVAIISEERYQFMMKMSVEAKVLEVLPDIYVDLGGYGTSTRYRVLHMQILDTLGGENMPDEIYYLLPVQYNADLTVYSSLILTLQQLEVENCVLVNETQQRAEAFSILFTGAYDAEKGSVLPFLDGKLDTELWEKPGWNKDNNGKVYDIRYLLSDKAAMYPGKPYRNLRETKKTIRQQFYEEYEAGRKSGNIPNRGNLTGKVRSYDEIRSAEGKELLAYVQPFENGVFMPKVDVVSWGFTRYINGFETNEIHYILREDQSAHSKNRFTEEDLQQLPDVTAIIEELNKRKNAHRIDQESGKELIYCGISGRYQKTTQGIYCILTRRWAIPLEEESSYPNGFVFSEWVREEIIVSPDGTWREATEEDVRKLYKL